MLLEIFTPLESLGKLTVNGLFNHPRPCKADQCTGFCQGDVSQCRKARRNPAGCRVRQETDKESAMFGKELNCRCGLCHLHQTEDAFLHSGAARRGENNQRAVFSIRLFHASGNLFSYRIRHGTHQEPTVHHNHHNRHSAYLSLGGNNRLFESGLLLQRKNLLFVFRKRERISYFDFLVQFLKSTCVIEHT